MDEQTPQLDKSQSQEKIAYSRLTSLINNMADAVIAVDEQIKVVLYNGAALNILDLNNIKIGDRLGKVLKPIDKNNQQVDIEKLVLSTNIPSTNRDLRLVYADSSISNLYLSIAPVRLGYGSTGQKGYVLLLRDITAEKSLEEERDEFISVVSHELRTPITIAEGNISNSQLILERNGSQEQIKQALEQAHNQILYLSDMINDLSTLSRAERGKLNLEVEAINIHDLILELSHNYKDEATRRGLKIKVELDANLELLNSSRLYVREILQNFITNALKYTPRGHITIAANQKSDGVEVRVSDTGIGISKADRERIFDKFYRAEDARTRKTNGTGLGLYVTMKLARLTNATIDFTSELNKGSTFIVHFPNINQVPNQSLGSHES